MKKAFWALCLVPLMGSFVLADDAALIKQLKLLNQVPEEQLNEKLDPAFSILRGIYDQDGPDFLNLRALLGKADIRSHLNPSARCVEWLRFRRETLISPKFTTPLPRSK